MRRFLMVLSTLVLGSASNARTQSEAPDLERFFSLIQTGSAAEVETALTQNPALATATDKFGFQAIHMLDYIELEEKLAVLIENGADINAQNDEGIGLIHILLDEIHLPAVLSAGASLDLRDRLGRTPVMIQLMEPEGLPMAAALLKAGANPNAKDSRGQTVLDYARLWNDPAVEKLVVDAGAVGQQ